MKKILVPTDFSECANNAIRVAISIAGKLDAQIHFLHFTSIPIDWVNLNDQEKMYPDVTRKMKDRQEKLNKLIRSCEKQGVSASSYIGYNESYQNIIDHINIHKIDLVVMGSHGTSGIKGAIMGSNAQKVIRLSTAPVIVVKPDVNEFTPVEMTVVSTFPAVYDESDQVHLTSFSELIEMAKALELRVHLLFINTPGGFTTSKDINSRIHPYLDMVENYEQPVIINASNLEEGISDFLEEHPDSLIGMVTHGETGLNRLIRGSQVESVVNHIDSLIMTVKMD